MPEQLRDAVPRARSLVGVGTLRPATLSELLRRCRLLLTDIRLSRWARARPDAPHARHPLPGQHGRGALAERPGAPAQGGRRPARRLRALPPPPRGGLVARPARRVRPPAAHAVARARPPAPRDRRLPLLLRAHARAEVAAVPDPARARQALGDALPRLRHPRQAAGRARLGEARRRPDRRLLRRDPLGARRGGRPAGDRPARVRRRRHPPTGSDRSSSTRPRAAGARAPST